MKKTFKCDMCGRVGNCGPEEDSEAELRAEFGSDVKKEDCNVVCDSCWEQVRPRTN